MRNGTLFLIVALAAVMILSTVVFAQQSVQFPAGWKPCPRCQNNEDRRQDTVKYKIEGHTFSPHLLTGVWGWDGHMGTFTKPPELTPWGKQQHDATMGEKAADGTPTHSKDTS